MRVWNQFGFVEIRWRSIQSSSPKGKPKPFCPFNWFRRFANICSRVSLSLLKVKVKFCLAQFCFVQQATACEQGLSAETCYASCNTLREKIQKRVIVYQEVWEKSKEHHDCFYFQHLAVSILRIWSNYFCELLPISISISDAWLEMTTTMTIPSVKAPLKNFPPFPKMLRRRGGSESSPLLQVTTNSLQSYRNSRPALVGPLTFQTLE